MQRATFGFTRPAPPELAVGYEAISYQGCKVRGNSTPSSLNVDNVSSKSGCIPAAILEKPGLGRCPVVSVEPEATPLNARRRRSSALADAVVSFGYGELGRRADIDVDRPGVGAEQKRAVLCGRVAVAGARFDDERAGGVLGHAIDERRQVGAGR